MIKKETTVYGRKFKAERISSDGVFFSCSDCRYTPMMGSETDDLIKMNYCPNCGSKFNKPNDLKIKYLAFVGQKHADVAHKLINSDIETFALEFVRYLEE